MKFIRPWQTCNSQLLGLKYGEDCTIFEELDIGMGLLTAPIEVL